MERKDGSRRWFLKTSVFCGATALAASFIPGPARAQQSLINLSDLGGICRLTPQQMAGPYFRNPNLNRSNIVEDRVGVPLLLNIVVVDVKSCSPVAGLNVDIWHCDNRGRYSGWDYMNPDIPAITGEVGGIDRSDDKTYLRGYQRTDLDGEVNFTSIYPGFYAERAVHIHIGVRGNESHPGGGYHFVGQMYFPEEINKLIQANREYAGRRIKRLDNNQDQIFMSSGGAESVAVTKFVNEFSVNHGVYASIVLYVDLSEISNYITGEDLLRHTV